MTTVTISLPESLKAFVDAQLASKGYGNVSEYFRTLLREAQKEEDNLRIERLLLESLDSGEPIPVDAAFWKRHYDRISDRTKKRPSKKKL